LFLFLGRGKKSKLKQMKKLMSLLGVIMCAKLSLMGPLAMVMIGAKAIKALLLAVVSLTISKMMLLKKLKSGGGGGGGGYGEKPSYRKSYRAKRVLKSEIDSLRVHIA